MFEKSLTWGFESKKYYPKYYPLKVVNTPFRWLERVFFTTLPG